MVNQSNATSLSFQFALGLVSSVLSTPTAKPFLEQVAYSVLPASKDNVVWMLQTLFVFLSYSIAYFGFATAFEYTHPDSAFSGKKDQLTLDRLKSVKYSIYYSSLAVFLSVCYAMTWIRFVDPILPFYGYYASHSYSFSAFCIELIVYMVLFDSWFYWTHRLLHLRKPFNFWYHVHTVHHAITNPTAYAQDAVHPFEALLQGPMGHHLVCLFMPMHPVSHSVFGFLTSIYAIAAHDARELDLNNHHYHHIYCHVNYGLYWGLWDYICGTRYQKGKYEKLKKWGQDPFERKNKQN